MQKDRTNLLLHESNMYKAFTILALPVLGANLLKSFHDLVDTFFIGQLPNSVAAQAGIAISWPLLNILISFNIGLSVAGVAIISQLLGAGKKDEAHRYSGMLVLFATGLGVLINVLLPPLSPFVMRAMGAEGEVFDCSVIYLQIRAFEMIFAFIFAAFQAIRQAQGDTITPVILSVVSVVLNIILTAAFIRGFGVGIEGAAIATVIGQAAIVPVCFYLLFSKKENISLRRRHFRVEKAKALRLVKIALPSAGSQALSSLGFLILQGVILGYGAQVAAAFSIGNKISNLLLMPTAALGSVLAAYVGQNIGAGNKERARRSYVVSRNLALLLSVLGAFLLYPLRTQALSLLTNDARTLSIALEYIFWVLLTQPLMGLFQNYLGLFNGSGNTRCSFYMASARLWIIRLPMIVFFKNFTDLGYSGIWYAMVISNFIILIYGKFLSRRVDFEPKIHS